MGTELAEGGTPGVVPGGYRVQIQGPDGGEIFSGRLQIAAKGEVFDLTWKGMLTSPPKEQGFSGIAVMVEDRWLVASFQEVQAPENSGKE
jgi:hypothetical protein